MLQPDERSLLVDGLRPPPGMQLDYAVGTTFSLDLEALLIAPVTFALFDARIAEGEGGTDPLSILEAVRRHAGNIDLFCQAGQINLPSEYRPITAYLEDAVHPSAAQRPHHLFHPKVWVLRFRSETDTAYRLLVLSRNLTFSRSWDVVVRIEGVPGAPDPANEPLARFLEALPDLRVQQERELPRPMQLADEIRSVKWTLPDGCTDLAFMAWGIGADPELPKYHRLLAIAPFASSPRLDKLATSGKSDVLISRSATLDRVDRAVLERFGSVYTMSSTAADETEPDIHATEELAERPGDELVGLHAKVYVLEHGSTSTVIAGSTNATEAGFGGNVEFAVGLTGRTRELGITEVLGSDEQQGSLLAMLEPYGPTEVVEEPGDVEKVQQRLEELGRQLAGIGFSLDVEEQEGDVFRLTLSGDRSVPHLGSASLAVWPISRPAAAIGLKSGSAIVGEFSGLSIQAITSFLCLELTERVGREHITARFVVNAALTGAPENRHQRILTAALQSKGDVMRYLLFLLADLGDSDAVAEVTRLIASHNGDAGGPAHEIPLFESMVRALDRRPASLDHIQRLITDLQQTAEGRALLPDGVEDVWPAIWQAREELRP